MKKTGRFNESPGSYQIDLFEHVAGAYAQPVTGRLSNEELYRISTGRAGINPSLLEQKQPVGRAGTKRNIPEKRYSLEAAIVTRSWLIRKSRWTARYMGINQVR
jgi:hypothetical protein